MSVFDRTFDVVVVGAGLTGFAAVRRLARENMSVLLIESSGDLLAEATRGLENDARDASASHEWEGWLDQLRTRGGANDCWFEPVWAEIFAADFLHSVGPGLRTLLYAAPVAVEIANDRLNTVIVGTKSGFRRISAGYWIDATDEGVVMGLAKPDASPRRPDHCFRSFVVQSQQPEILDGVAEALIEQHQGLKWLPSLRVSERRLRYPVVPGTPWHQVVRGLTQKLRDLLGGNSGAGFLVSHCAMRDYPVFEAASKKERTENIPTNLTAAGPGWDTGACATPSDRFNRGLRAAQYFLSKEAADVPMVVKNDAVPIPDTSANRQDHEVIVVGTGTAGALAAIAAGRSGARTLAVELASFPGGVGTGGGINGYFHGANGGLQDEVDARVQAMSVLLGTQVTSTKVWHYEAKKIVLLEMMEEAGVTFLGNTLLCGVACDAGRVTAVLVARDGKLERLSAPAFIDATGDGDVCALAGAPFSTGRPGDGLTLAFSQSAFKLAKGKRALLLKGYNFDAGWVDPTDPEDFSRGRLLGIAQYRDAELPTGEECIAIAPLIGLRQSRLISTDQRVGLADLILNRRFQDAVGEAATVADTHSVDFEFESDELAFYYWTCRGFRHRLACELPYGMLVPLGLKNVWISCRAAGMENDACYGLRMQRDMQRLGEAAGTAAGLAVATGSDARDVDMVALRVALERSGSLPTSVPNAPSVEKRMLLAALDEGRPGLHLWHLLQAGATCEKELYARLEAVDPNVSFYAATVLAMRKCAIAEDRLLLALEQRETGPTPEEANVPGAHGQCIDLPFWLQSVVFLRRVGTARCLPHLSQLAATPGLLLNVRTLIALTLERLAPQCGSDPGFAAALDHLVADEVPDPILPPSRSLWRTLHNEPQKPLGNESGVPTDEDHRWQLHLVVARTRKALNLAQLSETASLAKDPRGIVRHGFAAIK